MTTFYVIWTYIGNYSRLLVIEARNAADAHTRATGIFSQDFHAKGTVHVFDKPPVLSVGADRFVTDDE